MKPDQRLGDGALPLLSDWRSSLESEVRDTGLRSIARRRLRQTGKVVVPIWISNSNIHVASSPYESETGSFESPCCCRFCDQTPEKSFRLPNLSQKEWSGLLRWLDVSGLALYFLDRMMELQLSTIIPPQVLARLEQNLNDNQERTAGMIEEFVAIQQEFQGANLCYATLKGFSLSPHSVPRPELRHQFDLDFLVAEKSAASAREALECHGYRLHAMSGRSWEFKRDDAPGNIRDLYKNVPCRSVELHLETETPGQQTLLDRAEPREFHGITIPVLSPVDLLIGQGLHAYKHIRGEFSRTSHLLEFRRHVLSRREDDSFWMEVQSRVEKNVEAAVGLGIVTLLVTSIMGDFAPVAFTNCTVGRLDATARLWVNLYGPRVIFADTPGSKLYLLLQKELETEGARHGAPCERYCRPSGFPPRACSAGNCR